jgi:SAM-dependent methyltransferase
MEFTAHNIRLDDGTYTKPEIGYPIDRHPNFLSARKILKTVFAAGATGIRIADLGCLEGGYAVEFARLGFEVVGIEVRESNFAACTYVKEKTNLPNLSFVKDDALNIERYGSFDAIFCCGLLYHLDYPRKFINTLSAVCKRLLILQTHFAAPEGEKEGNSNYEFKHLSDITDNEGILAAGILSLIRIWISRIATRFVGPLGTTGVRSGP